MSTLDAVVIGAGPNGLAAAITLARAGRSVVVYEAAATPGGGCRTAELTEPGYRHDVCAAVHALGVVSPFFRDVPLEAFGLEWCQPPIPLAHPLDGGRAVFATHPLDGTLDQLTGSGRSRYRRLIEPMVADFDAVATTAMSPVLQVPKHPVVMARFGLRAVGSSSGTSRWLGEEAGALFAGAAAHSFRPLQAPMTASFGVMLLASAHAAGWPFARGGSQAIIDAMVAYLRSLGGEVVCDSPVRSFADLAPSRVVLADVAPEALAAIAGTRVPRAYAAAAANFRHGPGVFKIDYALDAPVPWANAEVGRAGTVHLGGTAEELAVSERAMWRGQHADAPYVLIAQPSSADDSRAPAGKHTLWAYCHVPAGSTRDMTDAIERQLERFAPGFRDVVRARHTMDTAAYAAYNANNVGGDIAGGVQTVRQLLARGPRTRAYATGADDVLLCSASTPPGAGVHGMCGMQAALVALRSKLR